MTAGQTVVVDGSPVQVARGRPRPRGAAPARLRTRHDRVRSLGDHDPGARRVLALRGTRPGGIRQHPAPGRIQGWAAAVDRAGRGADGCPRRRVLRGGGPLHGRRRGTGPGGGAPPAGDPRGGGLDDGRSRGAAVGRARRPVGRTSRAGRRTGHAEPARPRPGTRHGRGGRGTGRGDGGRGGRVRLVVPTATRPVGRRPHPVGADAGSGPRPRAARPRRRGPRHSAADGGAAPARPPGRCPPARARGDAATCPSSSTRRTSSACWRTSSARADAACQRPDTRSARVAQRDVPDAPASSRRSAAR